MQASITRRSDKWHCVEHAREPLGLACAGADECRGPYQCMVMCMLLHNRMHHISIIATCTASECGGLSKRAAGEWKDNDSAVPYVHSTRAGDPASPWPTVLHILHFLCTNMLHIMMHNTACTAHCTVRASGGLSMRAAGDDKTRTVRFWRCVPRLLAITQALSRSCCTSCK